MEALTFYLKTRFIITIKKIGFLVLFQINLKNGNKKNSVSEIIN